MASPFISTRVRPRVSGNAAYPHSSPSKTSRSHDFASCPIGGHRRKIYIGPRNIFIDSPFSPRLCFFPFPMMRGIIRRRQRDTEEIRQDGEGEIRRIAGTYHVSVRAPPIHYLSSPPLSVSGAGGGGCAAPRKSPLRIHEIDSSHQPSDMCTYHYRRRDPTSGRSKHTSPSRPIPSAWGSSRSW